MGEIPFEVNEQIIQCIGRCFHLKDMVASFMISAGVHKQLVDKYRHEYKFVWARRVLEELSESEDGRVIQRKILTNLCKLRNLPDSNVADRNAGLDALRNLKDLASSNQLYVEEQKKQADVRRDLAENRVKILEERANRLEFLKSDFGRHVTSDDRQAAGYALEDIIKELFFVYDLDYRKSYKTETQQIDGHFRFEGFDYIVEAKWKKDMPNEQEIAGFKQKIDTKLDSTRGVFISIPGFRDSVIRQFSGRGANIIFWSGQDLYVVLDGRMHLHDALRIKIEKAAQEGIVDYHLPMA
ncbi:restriction endonuclease [Pelosinus fermentans]|uniref:Restriction endonuclease n=1 Tax=Pelosinus fermentans JBW45 TaxID=1192197 RepID=I9NJW5_9FIRM|nr:restriction endonuclease [Pelosinus fermentans]AJQ25682.1 restriction endonuclease [Pelosinus fermentans JBW45]